jgi:FkbM family methyltransferase
VPTNSLRKLLYRIGLLTPFWQVDRTRYLKRVAKRKTDDWRYVARDDATQLAGEVVARLMGVSAPVFFYCDRSTSSIEAEILKTTKAENEAHRHRWRVLELGMDLISPHSRVVDVGANIGVYALPWAATCPGVTVHCFEPNPNVRARLARNVALNRLGARVRLHAEALSDRAGTAKLHGSGDMSSLNEGVHTDRQAAPTEVSLARLDDVLGGEGPPISLVKVDVQGHEPRCCGCPSARLAPPARADPRARGRPVSLRRGSRAAQERSAGLLSRLGYETLYVSRWGSGLLAVADWSRRLNGDLLALPLER